MNIIFARQSGFRTFHSCQSALTSLVDCWTSEIDQDKLVGVLLIDLRKACDLVNHDTLIKKLIAYNCSPATICFFQSYDVLFRGRQYASAKTDVGVHRGQFWAHFYSFYMSMACICIQNIRIVTCLSPALSLI